MALTAEQLRLIESMFGVDALNTQAGWSQQESADGDSSKWINPTLQAQYDEQGNDRSIGSPGTYDDYQDPNYYWRQSWMDQANIPTSSSNNQPYWMGQQGDPLMGDQGYLDYLGYASGEDFFRDKLPSGWNMNTFNDELTGSPIDYMVPNNPGEWDGQMPAYNPFDFMDSYGWLLPLAVAGGGAAYGALGAGGSGSGIGLAGASGDLGGMGGAWGATEAASAAGGGSLLGGASGDLGGAGGAWGATETGGAASGIGGGMDALDAQAAFYGNDGAVDYLGEALTSTGGTGAASGNWLDTILGNKNLLGSAVGAGVQGLSSYFASKAQQDAAREANATQWNMFQQNRADLAPWRNAGTTAVGQLTDLTTPGKQFDTMNLDPGYNFRKEQGQNALDNRQRAAGKFYSGPGLQGAAEYNQNYASNEFNNVYNRLAGIAGTGQTAAQNTAQLGANTANQVSNNQTGAGNARASGYVGFGNAVQNGIGQYNTLNQFDQMMKMFGGK